MNQNNNNASYKKTILIRRYVALLIDYLILSIYAGVLFLFSPILAPLFQKSAIQSEIFGLLFLVIPVILYFCIFEASHAKATPGKRLFHIKVKKTNGLNINIGNSFIRTLVKFVPWEMAHFAIWQIVFHNRSLSFIANSILIAANVVALIYFLFPFFNESARAIHDYAAHTILILD